MNEPIISPWLFYWIGVLHSYDVVNGFVFIALTIVMIFLLPGLAEERELTKEKVKYIIKKALYVWVLLLLGVIFIPSKETTYKMLVAQYVTPKNVEITTHNAEKLIERISELVVSKEKESEKK